MSRWGRKPKTVEQRFWEKVDIKGEEDCWVWLAGRKCGGERGRFQFCGRDEEAPRVALFLTIGPPPLEKPWALHRCREPLCCNPQHLEWGTPSKNNGEDRHRDGTLNLGNLNGRRNKFRTQRAMRVKKLLRDGVRRLEICRLEGISLTSISNIKTGKCWSK